MSNNWIIIPPPGADPVTNQNWRVVRQVIESLGLVQAQVSGGISSVSSHEDLTDMPSKENEDHDDRYIIEMQEPADPVIGKAWLDESEGPLTGSGIGIPAGGDDGQILTKQSGTNYDADWKDAPDSFPEAPVDGAPYVREDAGWVKMPDSVTIATAEYASRPAASKAGNLFFPTDSIYVERDTGAAWESWGPVWKCKPFVAGDFGWVNQGAATIASVGGMPIFSCANASGLSIKALVKSVSAPYVVTVGLMPNIRKLTATHCGLVFRDSATGKLSLIGYGPYTPFFFTSNYTNETTASGSATASFTITLTDITNPVWLRIADDNTDMIFSWSRDKIQWNELYRVARGTFLTANQVGMYLSPNAASGTTSTGILSWEQS